MIDQRYSRTAFESLRVAADRNHLARELADELRGHIAAAPNPEDGLAAALARLRLIGHVLYPKDDGERTLFAGDTAGDEPTGLEIEVRQGELSDVRYRRR